MKYSVLLIGACLWASGTALYERGAPENKISGQILTLMGAANPPSDPAFVTAFTAGTFTDDNRKDVLEKISQSELQQFVKNPAPELAAHKDQALDIYLNKFGNRRLLILENTTSTENVLFFENEVAFKEIAAFTDFATPVATKTKAICFDFHVMSFPAPPNPPTEQKLADNMLGFSQTNLAATLEKVELRRVFGREYKLIDDIRFPEVYELSLVDSFLYYYGYTDPPTNSILEVDANGDLVKKAYNPMTAFPKVTRLAISGTEFSDNAWIKTHYKTLTHLIIDSSSGNFYSDDEITEAVTANTPTLTDIGIISINPKMLRTLGQAGAFPNTTTLGLKSFSGHFTKYPETIQVAGFTKFYFDEAVIQRNAKVIQFTGLEELWWRSEDKAENKLAGFIYNHRQQLKTITIEKATIKDADLQKWANMEKLEEITIIFDPSKTIEMTGAEFAKFVLSNSKETTPPANPSTKKLQLVRLVTQDMAFRTAVDAALSANNADGTPSEWSESFPVSPAQPDPTRIVFVKGPKTPDVHSNKFRFFQTYF